MTWSDLLTQYRRPMGWLLCGMIAANMLALSLPLGLKVMIDHHGFGQNAPLLWTVLAGLSAAIVLKTFFQWRIRLSAAIIAEQIACDLSLQIYSHALKLSIHDVRRQKPAYIINYLNTDIETLRRFGVMELLESVYSLLSITVAVIFLAYLNPWLVGIALAAVLLSAVFNIGILPQLKQNFFRLKEARAMVTARAAEVLNAAPVVRMLDTAAHEKEFFAAHQRKMVTRALKNYSLSGMLTGATDLFLGLALVGILGMGGWYMEAWHLTSGTLAAFYSYTMMLFGPLLRLGALGSSVQQARSSWERIQTFLNSPIQESIPSILIAPSSLQSSLRADGLCYRYPGGRMVIDNVSLSVQPGETLGVVGPSGAGKTTLVYLLTGLLNPQQGTIRLGGWNLNAIDRTLLSQWVGVVFQDDYVFSSTIMDNICYGHFDCSDQEVYAAARAAGAADFIEALKEGYQTVLNEKGLNLSGGQRQRIALARALVRQPKVLVLDEATCALDALTENAVQDSVRRFCPEAAIITVAHRFSTIIDADRILVIENGKIIEQGDHNNLLRRQGLYSTLYFEQFKDA